jgi:hypothetical protein
MTDKDETNERAKASDNELVRRTRVEKKTGGNVEDINKVAKILGADKRKT